MNILISSHSDLDALGCYILYNILRQESEDTIDFWMNNYGDYEDNVYEYDQLKSYDKIIYADFSPDEKCRAIIQENNIPCIVCDHHIAVEEDLKAWDYDKKEYYFDNEKCGTKIFYEYLIKNYNLYNNKVLEEFIELVDTYDLWKKDSELWIKASDLNRLLYKTMVFYKEGISKYTTFVSLIMNKILYEDSFEFNKIEQQKIIDDKKREDTIFNDIIKNPAKTIKTRKDSKGRHFCVIKCNTKVSMICNRLLDKYSKLDYVFAINTFNKDRLSISVRSKPHINLMELEGIKGHEQAAGLLNVDQELIDNLWSGKVYSFKYKEVETNV